MVPDKRIPKYVMFQRSNYRWTAETSLLWNLPRRIYSYPPQRRRGATSDFVGCGGGDLIARKK